MVSGLTMERDDNKVDQYFGGNVNTMAVRQTRRGWLQQCFGCEALDEFKWYTVSDEKNDHIATSLEESGCCMRVCCPLCHEFKMVIKEEDTKEEILSLHRPFALGPGACKCCCYQQMRFSSKGKEIGQMKEQYYYFVPRFVISDASGNPVYKVHSPTCCGGICVNCCAEGNPCFGRGCCKLPFHIFPATQRDTDSGAPYAGKIVKIPKSLKTEFFTAANAFDVHFPENATSEQKAMIAGSSVLLNAMFFDQAGEGK